MNAAWRVSALLLGVGCALLAYRVFDQGVTLTYARASQTASDRHNQLLTGLIAQEWLGLPQDQIMVRLQKYAATAPPGSIVLKHEPETGDILFEGIRLKFREGKLASVN